ncbi:class I SAM-dependent methyltransferase [Hydrogenophaga sp. BPS33]|uniref:class I SAM-dependent methyltransferase n=1 Tax=Hydrogenophaga sp. BPS33 TaxID=2651974 RepID=UPI001320339B|nr:class I SAM-dependent methyltransferase [Hydrogenophaga sp. BPS33]QHE83756.1 class I SAM-dependent methyltransferase [Hydrogenophaga sp. BPS33]
MKRQLKALVNRFPRLKAVLRRLLPSRGVSSHYVELGGAEAAQESSRLRDAWQDNHLPTRQRELVDRQLADYRRGAGIDVFDVLVNALRKLNGQRTPLRVLEIGCSSGYYGEVLQIAGVNASYEGCDYSDSFIALARERYPQWTFQVQDATKLDYPDRSFDVAISGCCLLHIPEYESAVAETARVADRYAIFHRTPVLLGQPNKTFRKLAYGVETVEIHFNEPDFLALLTRHGLDPIETLTLDESVVSGVGSASRTYVCRKRTP